MMRSAVAIGTFDGVHCGHRHLLDTLLCSARRDGLRSMVVTLARPVRPVAGLLTTLDEKLELLRQLPFDEIIVLPTTVDIIDQPAAQFFDSIIVKSFGAKRLVVGENFAFGYGREGDKRWLQAKGPARGVSMTFVRPLKSDHEVISSSRIRALIEEGDSDMANRLLGRFYAFEGTVVSGRAIGRQIGFPTVNLSPDPEKLLPAGVFAALVERKNMLLPAVMNIGTRPTFFENGSLAVEINLLGFRGVWNEDRAKVHICRRLRSEMQFLSIDALRRQLSVDVRDAETYFGCVGRETSSGVSKKACIINNKTKNMECGASQDKSRRIR